MQQRPVAGVLKSHSTARVCKQQRANARRPVNRHRKEQSVASVYFKVYIHNLSIACLYFTFFDRIQSKPTQSHYTPRAECLVTHILCFRRHQCARNTMHLTLTLASRAPHIQMSQVPGVHGQNAPPRQVLNRRDTISYMWCYIQSI